MTRSDYIDSVLKTYGILTILSQKNGVTILRLRHKTLKRELVLHSIPEECIAYEALVPIRCDNLPEIYDVIGLEDGTVVLEEYVEGQTLADLLTEEKPSPKAVRTIMQGLCHALDVLHGLGFVHRDVKPENVIIKKDGTAVLIDFGITRKILPEGKDTRVMGTVGYAAPEQLGLAQSDVRTDLYALGVLYNVLLTGCHPSRRIASGRAGRIIRKCTSVNPDDRYASARKLSEIL
ncbi:MAG: serine/threonine protein kinase [Clostridia bacterium]|nr:serine/threonine protein kinase [Clostridia bacterium]